MLNDLVSGVFSVPFADVTFTDSSIFVALHDRSCKLLTTPQSEICSGGDVSRSITADVVRGVLK